MESPWEGETKVDINGPGYMTKMAAMPIYGKNLLQNQKSYDLETWLKLYKDYINYDPRLTLTFFTARSYWVAYTFELGKLLQSHLMGNTCSKGLN